MGGIQAHRKEFVAKLKDNFSKYTMAGTDFTPWFEKKLEDEPDFRAKWENTLPATNGTPNSLADASSIRAEAITTSSNSSSRQICRSVRTGGRLSLLVPSGLQTDEGCGPLRKLMLTEHRFEELTSFENRGYPVIENGKEKTKHIFPDVDSRFKFGFFKVQKGKSRGQTRPLTARFYLLDPKDVFAQPIHYSVEMIRRFSPENFGIMEFRSE